MKISTRVILVAAALLASRNAEAAPQRGGGSTAEMELDEALDTDPDLSNFAALLRYQPMELDQIKMAIAKSPVPVQVYAPGNDAPTPPTILATVLGNSSAKGLTRRDKGDFRAAYHASYQRNNRRRRRRRDTGATDDHDDDDDDEEYGDYDSYSQYDYGKKPEKFDYPAGVRDTLLTDPKYVNLGKGIPQRLVSKSSGAQMLEISAGEGKTVQTENTPISFKGGVIYPITDYFTLPEGLCESLDNKGLKGLLENIRKQHLVDKVENYPGVTLFAPLNPTKESIKKFLLLDNVAYSPDLEPGSTWHTAAGTTITIEKSKDGEGLTANGYKIVLSDAIVRNGVVHYIDNTEKTDSYY